MTAKIEKKTKLYKVLEGTDSPIQGFDYEPFLPKSGNPGKWTPPVQGVLRRCAKGYHLTTDVEYWLTMPAHTPTVYEAEGKGERVYNRPDSKRVFRSIRLLRRVPRSRWPQAWKRAR